MAALESFPFGLALALLWCVAMLRGQATYWLARTLTEQTLRHTRPSSGWRASLHTWLASDALDRGRGAVQRCGIAAVPLCYLTVGVQTVVLASAGVLRMPWLRFTAAQSLGALAWAAIYATVGFAVWAAFLGAALDGGVGGVVLLAVVLALVAAGAHRWYVVRRRVSATQPQPEGTDLDDERMGRSSRSNRADPVSDPATHPPGQPGAPAR